MINAPFFPIATPGEFHDFQLASANKDDPTAVKQFTASHPSLRAFSSWAASAPYTESYAEDRFNSLNSFVVTNAQGQSRTVRWSFVPTAASVSVPLEELKKRDPNFSAREISERVAAAPQTWQLLLTLADPGDPTRAWPDER